MLLAGQTIDLSRLSTGASRACSTSILAGFILTLATTLPAQPPGIGGNPSGLPRINRERALPANTFITGDIFLEDGGGISSPISIVGGCRGAMHVLGYSDLKGHFTIDLKPGN